MKKQTISLSLALLLLLSLSGCAKKPETQLTPEARTSLYTTAIESARDTETNSALPLLTDPNDEQADLLLGVLGLSKEDMSAFAVSVSPMNVRAYGVAAVYPAAGKDEAVSKALRDFINNQKQSFERYLEDQYEIASNTRLETLEDGTILMVMSENQDAIFDSIKDAVESKK